MNGIFFLLPFLAIVSFGLIQDSFAAVEQDVVGINYFDVVNPDGTHTWSSHHEYILDNGVYVPYIQNGLTVNSKIGDVTLNQDGSYIWNGKFDDRIVGKYADISDLTTWTYPESLNNVVPILSFVNDEFHANKFKAGVAGMDYKYVFNNGQWKTELVITNLSSLTTKVFGFDQIINLNTDSIEIDGRIYNIDDFDGVVLSKLFLDNNKGKVLNLMNGVNFDFDLGYENLYSVTIHDTGVNSSQLVLDYRTNTILLPKETLVIDPTFGYSTGTKLGYSTDAGTGTSCPANPATNAWIGLQSPDSTSPSKCYRMGAYFDTTSITDPTITVSAMNLKTTQTTGGGVFDCSVRTYAGTLSTDSASTAWSNISSGTNIITTWDCDTTATDQVTVLGSIGWTDFENNYASGEYGLGFIITAEEPRTTSRFIDMNAGAISIEVTYTTPIPTPDSITDLSLDSVTQTTAIVSFSAPNLNGETLVN